MRSNINIDLQRRIAGRVRSDESRVFQVFALLGISHKAIGEALKQRDPVISTWASGNSAIPEESFAALVSLAHESCRMARQEAEHHTAKAKKHLDQDFVLAELMLFQLEEAAPCK